MCPETTAATPEETLSPPPSKPKKKRVRKKKTGTSSSKANGSAETPKKSTSKKAAAKKKRVRKKKSAQEGKSTKATQVKDGDPQKSSKTTDKTRLGESDVEKICKEINELYGDFEKTKLERDFEIGRRISELKAETPAGQYQHVLKNKIVDRAGNPLSSSWCNKVRNYYRLFKDHRDRALKVGLRKKDIVMGLAKHSETEARKFLLEGIQRTKDGQTTVIYPEDMSCQQLEDFIAKRIKKHKGPEASAEEKLVKAIASIRKKLEGFLSEHGETWEKGQFTDEQKENLAENLKAISSFPGTLRSKRQGAKSGSEKSSAKKGSSKATAKKSSAKKKKRVRKKKTAAN